MEDRDVDDFLNRAVGAAPEVDPALLAGISSSLGARTGAVEALPASGRLTGRLILISMAVAAIGATCFGLADVRSLSGLEIGVIFSALAILIWLAAALSVAEAVPGSRRPIAPWLLGVVGCIDLAAVFGLLFHDYGTERFVTQGVKCLAAGLGVAIPAALLVWWVLRRGFSVNVAGAAFAKGLLAGLAGVTMLELHCANFEVPHLLVWHIAVLPICGAGAAVFAWARQRLTRR